MVGFCARPCVWKGKAKDRIGGRVHCYTYTLSILWTSQKDTPFMGVYKCFDYWQRTSLERYLLYYILGFLKMEQDLFPRSHVHLIKLIWWQLDNIKMLTLKTSSRVWVNTLHNLLNGAVPASQTCLFQALYKLREAIFYTHLRFWRFSSQLQLWKLHFQNKIWNSEEPEGAGGT